MTSVPIRMTRSATRILAGSIVQGIDWVAAGPPSSRRQTMNKRDCIKPPAITILELKGRSSMEDFEAG